MSDKDWLEQERRNLLNKTYLKDTSKESVYIKPILKVKMDVYNKDIIKSLEEIYACKFEYKDGFLVEVE